MKGLLTIFKCSIFLTTLGSSSKIPLDLIPSAQTEIRYDEFDYYSFLNIASDNLSESETEKIKKNMDFIDQNLELKHLRERLMLFANRYLFGSAFTKKTIESIIDSNINNSNSASNSKKINPVAALLTNRIYQLGDLDSIPEDILNNIINDWTQSINGVEALSEEYISSHENQLSYDVKSTVWLHDPRNFKKISDLMNESIFEDNFYDDWINSVDGQNALSDTFKSSNEFSDYLTNYLEEYFTKEDFAKSSGSDQAYVYLLQNNPFLFSKMSNLYRNPDLAQPVIPLASQNQFPDIALVANQSDSSVLSPHQSQSSVQPNNDIQGIQDSITDALNENDFEDTSSQDDIQGIQDSITEELNENDFEDTSSQDDIQGIQDSITEELNENDFEDTSSQDVIQDPLGFALKKFQYLALHEKFIRNPYFKGVDFYELKGVDHKVGKLKDIQINPEADRAFTAWLKTEAAINAAAKLFRRNRIFSTKFKNWKKNNQISKNDWASHDDSKIVFQKWVNSEDAKIKLNPLWRATKNIGKYNFWDARDYYINKKIIKSSFMRSDESNNIYKEWASNVDLNEFKDEYNASQAGHNDYLNYIDGKYQVNNNYDVDQLYWNRSNGRLDADVSEDISNDFLSFIKQTPEELFRYKLEKVKEFLSKIEATNRNSIDNQKIMYIPKFKDETLKITSLVNLLEKLPIDKQKKSIEMFVDNVLKMNIKNERDTSSRRNFHKFDLSVNNLSEWIDQLWLSLPIEKLYGAHAVLEIEQIDENIKRELEANDSSNVPNVVKNIIIKNKYTDQIIHSIDFFSKSLLAPLKENDQRYYNYEILYLPNSHSRWEKSYEYKTYARNWLIHNNDNLLDKFSDSYNQNIVEIYANAINNNEDYLEIFNNWKSENQYRLAILGTNFDMQYFYSADYQKDLAKWATYTDSEKRFSNRDIKSKFIEAMSTNCNDLFDDASSMMNNHNQINVFNNRDVGCQYTFNAFPNADSYIDHLIAEELESDSTHGKLYQWAYTKYRHIEDSRSGRKIYQHSRHLERLFKEDFQQASNGTNLETYNEIGNLEARQNYQNYLKNLWTKRKTNKSFDDLVFNFVKTNNDVYRVYKNDVKIWVNHYKNKINKISELFLDSFDEENPVLKEKYENWINSNNQEYENSSRLRDDILDWAKQDNIKSSSYLIEAIEKFLTEADDSQDESPSEDREENSNVENSGNKIFKNKYNEWKIKDEGDYQSSESFISDLNLWATATENKDLIKNKIIKIINDESLSKQLDGNNKLVSDIKKLIQN